MQIRYALSAAAMACSLLFNAIAAASDDPDAAEISSYRLSIDVARKMDAVNLGMARAFAETGEDDPELFADASTLDEMEAALEANPIAAEALDSAGLSAREYVRFLVSWTETAMYAGLVKEKMLPELPPEVRPENVRFLEEHEAELTAMRDGWENASSE